MDLVSLCMCQPPSWFLFMWVLAPIYTVSVEQQKKTYHFVHSTPNLNDPDTGGGGLLICLIMHRVKRIRCKSANDEGKHHFDPSIFDAVTQLVMETMSDHEIVPGMQPRVLFPKSPVNLSLPDYDSSPLPKKGRGLRKQQTLAIQPITSLKSHVGPSLPCGETTPLPNKTLNLKKKNQKSKKSDQLAAARQNPSRRQQMIKSFPPHLLFFIICVTHSTGANF